MRSDATSSGPQPEGRRPRTPPGYWLLAGVLIGFGLLGILSVGLPFLCLGLALVLLAPTRSTPERFWPPLVGIASFFAGYFLVAPLRCTETATGAIASGVESISRDHTVCASLFGIHQSGAGGANPSLWPAAIAGLLALGAAWAVARFLILRARGRTPSIPPAPDPGVERPRNDPWRWLGVGAVVALSLAVWFLTIPALLLGLLLVVVLAARRRPGWPLILAGFGLATAPFTLGLWLAPECVNEFSDLRPGHQVTRCLERAPVEVWPAVASLGLIAIGLLLYRRQRNRVAPGSPVA